MRRANLHRTRRVAFLATLLVGAPCLGMTVMPAEAAAFGTPINKQASAKATGTVEVNNVAGSVKIEAWSKNTVQVTGTLGKGVERLDFRSSGGRTKINVVGPKRGNMEGTDLNIKVPAGSQLDVTTVSANVDVKGTRGDVRVRSVSGNVTSSATPSEVEIVTVSGKVDTTSGTTRTNVKSVSGSIAVRGRSGDLRLKTVSGKLTASSGPFGRAELGSVSGDLRLDGGLGTGGPFKFKSHSGDIKLSLPGGVKLSVDLTTFSGRIRSDFGGSVKSGHGPGSSLRLNLGGGGPDLRANTFSGNIALKKR